MISVLDNLNIFVNQLASLRSPSGELHHARFARAHELKTLTTHSLDETALLLGRTHFGGIYRVTPTRLAGNLATCWSLPRPVQENLFWP